VVWKFWTLWWLLWPGWSTITWCPVQRVLKAVSIPIHRLLKLYPKVWIVIIITLRNFCRKQSVLNVVRFSEDGEGSGWRAIRDTTWRTVAVLIITDLFPVTWQEIIVLKAADRLPVRKMREFIHIPSQQKPVLPLLETDWRMMLPVLFLVLLWPQLSVCPQKVVFLLQPIIVIAGTL
jgi:hypothetical protein